MGNIEAAHDLLMVRYRTTRDSRSGCVDPRARRDAAPGFGDPPLQVGDPVVEPDQVVGARSALKVARSAHRRKRGAGRQP